MPLWLRAQCHLRRAVLCQFWETHMKVVKLAAGIGTFALEGITGLPWIEIDFVADVGRAIAAVLPRISNAIKSGAQTNEPRLAVTS